MAARILFDTPSQMRICLELQYYVFNRFEIETSKQFNHGGHHSIKAGGPSVSLSTLT